MRQAAPSQWQEQSEQFHYWAIKTNTQDQWPNQDGTLLQYARDAMAADGICPEPDWPYVGQVILGNVSQGGNGMPSPAAVSAGLANRQAFSHSTPPTGQGASAVLACLAAGRPAAVSLPVFKDPTTPPNSADNWSTPVGWLYGRVIDPPPTATVSGGHAVCITGFVPDANEPTGGYFIFRNSWGTQWAGSSPSPVNSHSPEPGYGEISATYVDTYIWELMQL